METKEIKDLEYLKKLMSLYLNTLKTPTDNTEYFTAEIKLLHYGELGCVITNMLKLCILALDSEAQEISKRIKNPSVDVVLILEVILQLFPVDEFELLSEINELLIANSKIVGKK
ncbi:hypothetical protein [Flavobacterium sp. FlaQc-48]|uniref:hypothetical protein n=1 Tax=Flavobacterium sp. FlaQc-48 TaxID=3374181 RepID=UPI00375765B5